MWLEITTLLIPGRTTATRKSLPMQMDPRVGVDVPVHFTAFHPDYKMLTPWLH